MIDDPYLVALRLLAIRELSEAQIRQRLARRGHDQDAIETAVTRLKADRSIDDERVAGAIARSETGLRKRGRLRVKRRIEAAGIAPAIAQRAIDETFQEIDGDALLAAALDKRLRGRSAIADDREFQRLYRYLAGQGFESDRILALLRSRRARRSNHEGHEEQD
jgi:regulatory protein